MPGCFLFAHLLEADLSASSGSWKEKELTNLRDVTLALSSLAAGFGSLHAQPGDELPGYPQKFLGNRSRSDGVQNLKGQAGIAR